MEFEQLGDSLGAALIALGGTILGLIAGFVTAELTRRQKADELFFKALDFLKGGSQNRNLGISAIELYGTRGRHRQLSTSLLTGSAIYLLLESGQQSKAHELYNLDRIMVLLTGQRSTTTGTRQYLARAIRLLGRGRSVRSVVPAYSALLDAVKQKQSGHQGGLKVSSDRLDQWRMGLERLLQVT